MLPIVAPRPLRARPPRGLSAALGTFLAGVVLAESEYRHELESDIEPFKGLLLGVFFIAVGSAIDVGVAKCSSPSLEANGNRAAPNPMP